MQATKDGFIMKEPEVSHEIQGQEYAQAWEEVWEQEAGTVKNSGA